MEVVYARCCGLDIHKKSIVACLALPGPRGTAATTVRTFGTMTADILALSDWLTGAGCTQVAMESTGVYWKPLWNLLEGLSLQGHFADLLWYLRRLVAAHRHILSSDFSRELKCPCRRPFRDSDVEPAFAFRFVPRY